jgi:LuxR family transcriptional regulator/LuxR family quorum-sensing system transcriptional regulator CciR
LHRFGRFAEQIHGVAHVRQLKSVLIEFFSSCGVKMMSYHHLPPPGAADFTPHVTVAAEGFPPEWVRRYERELIGSDPITRKALTSLEVFRWSDAMHFADLSDAERYFLTQLEGARLGDGLAVPVFGPYGRSGYVGLGFGANGTHSDPVVVAIFQAACQLGHHSYCRILFAKRDEHLSLSPREAEILLWVARGKSNAVIAEILSISAFTVNTHLRRTFAKLAVNDRVTAALRGAAMGLV